jgi:peptidoglycan/xylan/chitin deacetylase (PgdA/CDA1 family)
MRRLVLNFHGVGPVTRSIDQGELDCWLDTDFFDEVLNLIGKRGNVLVTVDDGNESDFTHILPALLKRGLRAKFFICSARLDQPDFLSRARIREMLAAGMEIGSHGVDHHPWRSFSAEQLDGKLQSSRRILEEACGVTVDEAACPFGSYDRKVLSALHRAGYRRVYTSDGGAAGEGGWIIPRTTVTRRMSLENIRSLLDHGPGFFKQASVRAKSFCKRLR